MSLWLFLLIICNLGLLKGAPATNLIFLPEAITDGQWWRLLSWQFVHVSPYHLLLDGSAFLMLYHGLDQPRRAGRLFYLAATALGSLLLPLVISGDIQHIGLCGLSGIAHGLLGITAMELLNSQPRRSLLGRSGALLLAGLIGKCALELITGKVLFAGLHLGPVGTPVVATHAGGLLGGMAGFFLLAALQKHSIRYNGNNREN